MARTARNVYVVLKGAEVFLMARAGGPGIRWGIGPAYTAKATVNALAEALSAAISNAPTEFAGMPNLRNYVSPLDKAMRVKSVHAFEKGTKHFAVSVDDSAIKLERLVPIPKSRTSLVDDADWAKTFPLNIDVAEIARIILEAAPTSPGR